MTFARAYPSDATTSTDWISAIPSVREVPDLDISEIIKDQKRKRKHIDRIAWKAETAQRFAKGMHWK